MDKRKLAIGLIVFVLIVVLAIGLGVGLSAKTNSSTSSTSKQTESFYTKAAVATDAEQCSKIGRDVLKEGGHAVDAAVASLICTGVVNFHSTGIAGGGFMIVYDAKAKKSKMFDYREVGPASLTATSYDDDRNKALLGGSAVGVPGELRGLKKAHEEYGKLNWSRLIQPSIDLAENGFSIGKHLYGNMVKQKSKINADPGLKELLTDQDGNLLKLRDIVKNPKYADSLRKIQSNPDDLNTGNLSKILLSDVNNNGGNMTADDLKNYEVKLKEPIRVKLNENLTLHTTALPGGGSVLVHILNMIEGYGFAPSDESTLEKKTLTYHRVVESFKFSYAMRPHLGDPDLVPDSYKNIFDKYKTDILTKENATYHRNKINDTSTQDLSYYDPYFVTTEDEGTTHVSILDENGNAVSATDTINYAFGAKLRSTTSGIIYNNELADFFTNSSYKTTNKDSSKTYFPKPMTNAPGAGRRPLSSTCPSIITDENGKVVMVVGGSGGTRITLSTAWVIFKKLWLGYTLSDAIEDARPQHALFPEYIRNEKENQLSEDIVKGLEAKNHVIKLSTLNAIVQGIFVEGDQIYAKSDPRKEGKSAGY